MFQCAEALGERHIALSLGLCLGLLCLGLAPPGAGGWPGYASVPGPGPGSGPGHGPVLTLLTVAFAWTCWSSLGGPQWKVLNRSSTSFLGFGQVRLSHEDRGEHFTIYVVVFQRCGFCFLLEWMAWVWHVCMFAVFVGLFDD